MNENPFDANNIILLKTTLGESILAMFMEGTDTYVKVAFPLIIRSLFGEVLLSSFCPYSDDHIFKFQLKDIQHLSNANAASRDLYSSALQEYEEDEEEDFTFMHNPSVTKH